MLVFPGAMVGHRPVAVTYISHTRSTRPICAIDSQFRAYAQPLNVIVGECTSDPATTDGGLSDWPPSRPAGRPSYDWVAEKHIVPSPSNSICGGLWRIGRLWRTLFFAEIRVRGHLVRLVRTFFQKEFGPFGPGAPQPPAPGRPSAGGFLDPPDHDLVSRVRGGNEQNLIILIKQRT
jgi:hypothetical protein